MTSSTTALVIKKGKYCGMISHPLTEYGCSVPTAAAPSRAVLAEDEVIRSETVTQAILDVEF